MPINDYVYYFASTIEFVQNFGVQVKICKIKVNLPKGYTSHQRNEATKNANAMDATTVPEDVNDEADIAMLLQDENEDADVS